MIKNILLICKTTIESHNVKKKVQYRVIKNDIQTIYQRH